MSETNDNVSKRLMLLDYEFDTVLKYKMITHFSFKNMFAPAKVGHFNMDK